MGAIGVRAGSRHSGLAAVFLGVLATAGCAGAQPSGPVSGAAPPSPTAATTPVVVSTDLGISDILAISFLAGRSDVNLLGVAVAGDGFAHCPVGGVNAQRILIELGKAEVPAGCGSDRSLSESAIAFPEGLRAPSDEVFQAAVVEAVEPTVADAVDVLAAAIDTSDRPVTVLLIGPATTLAEALRREPDLADKVERLVWMGGAIDVPGTAGPDFEGVAEWNMALDPVAATILLETAIPITLIPLDATRFVPITQSFYSRLEAGAGSGPGNLAWELLWRQNAIVGSAYFWDPLAAVSVVEPGVLSTEMASIRVVEAGEEAGKTLRDEAGRSVDLAVGADRLAFESAFLLGLQGGAARATVFALPGPVGEVTVAYHGEGVCTIDQVVDGGPGGYLLHFENGSTVFAGGGIVAMTGGATPAELAAWVAERGPNPGPPPAELARWINGVDAVVDGEGEFLLELGSGTHAAVCSPWEGDDAAAVYVSEGTFEVGSGDR